jgi:diguanylate cyclase (GGDEF)-like protein
VFSRLVRRLPGVPTALGGFLALPPAARLWWLGTVLVALGLLPWCLSVEQPRPPLVVPLLVGLGNALLVVVTTHRRQVDSASTFDYGSVATMTLLVLCGPAAALAAHAGEKLASAMIRNPSGQRPPWIRSVYNLAWGCPVLACAWVADQLTPDVTWSALSAGGTWWLINGLLVGPMVALARRRSWLDGVRLLGQNGWLRAQEAVLVLFAVLAWRGHPLLIGGVVLLLVGQAMTSRRLLREYEAATLARQEAEAEHRRAEAEATRARLDPLTQLPNRHALNEALDRPPRAPAVLMIDLDHFKRVNDSFGHDAGDAVLIAVGEAIRAALRPTDFCARLGGEEFCALLGEIGSDSELCEIAERVRLAVAGVRLAAFPLVRVTASIGAQRVPPGLGPNDALRYADRATYRAKADGRDCVRLYAAEAGAERAA